MNQIDSRLTEEGEKVAAVAAAYYAELEGGFEKPVDIGPAQQQAIVTSKFDQGVNLSVYHYYPFFFIDELPQISVEKVRQVALAGYIYTQHLFRLDALIDRDIGEHDPARCKTFLQAALLHEKSLNILHSLFAPDSPFWHYLDIYHKEFSRAVFLEGAKHVGRISPYPDEERQQIARGKSAMAKVSVAALAILAQDEAKIAPLTTSQDWAAEGLQLYDDVNDWKRDYRKKSYSYPLTRIITEGGFESKMVDGTPPDAKTIGQVLYYSGFAQNLLEHVENCYQEALCSIDGLNCPNWVAYVEQLWGKCRKLKDDLNQIKDRTLSVYQKPAKNCPVPLPSVVEQARHFLESGQTDQGYWGDFHTTAFLSTGWVTGYVGAALGADRTSADVLANARRWLFDNQIPQGGWAYDEHLPIDADSTSWCLIFLSGLEGKTELSQGINALLTHQMAGDGGFRTYAISDPIREFMHLDVSTDFSGWCSSQLCVTAVAVQALLGAGLERDAQEIQSALAYIRKQQESDGYWESYWWDGRVYGTCHAIKALQMAGLDKGDKRRCHKAVQWLLRVQLKNGSWNNGIAGNGRPFHTALAIQALLSIGESKIQEAVAKGINWLLQEQVDDGSWRSYAILRVPHPWTLFPWEEHFLEQNNGTGVIVRDHLRQFTTATVLGALMDYQAVTKGD